MYFIFVESEDIILKGLALIGLPLLQTLVKINSRSIPCTSNRNVLELAEQKPGIGVGGVPDLALLLVGEGEDEAVGGALVGVRHLFEHFVRVETENLIFHRFYQADHEAVSVSIGMALPVESREREPILLGSVNQLWVPDRGVFR